jgi:Cu/Ag efflux pump CusA
MRRGIGELDGEGEAAGGVIVMRSGKNALETIAAVKAKLQERCRPACPRAWRSCRSTTAPA